MATIYDVAKQASVSIGTVSKYLNDNGYINPLKKELIKQAIESLNYTPNRAAKQLKAHASQDIAIILPNLTDKIYSEFFTGASESLMPYYRVLIYLTHGVKSYETQILKDCMNNHCAGIFLCTCQPDNDTLFSKINSHLPLIFILTAPIHHTNYNFIGFNDAHTIYALTDQLLKLGYKDIAFYITSTLTSSQKVCVDAFKKAYLTHAIPLDNCSYPLTYSPCKELTFHYTLQRLIEGHIPSVFLTTSYSAATAINEALHFRESKSLEDIFIISLGEVPLSHTIFSSQILPTSRDYQKLGQKAAQVLIETISTMSFYQPQYILLEDTFKISHLPPYLNAKKDIKPCTSPLRSIRILTSENNNALESLKYIIPRFIQDEHINIEVTALPYNTLFAYINDPSNMYDLFLIDRLWLPYLADKGLLKELTNHPIYKQSLRTMNNALIENTASYNGKIYGIPCTYLMPLLYYRKDLFYDSQIANHFYTIYNQELRPPKNWVEFNAIAKYFTQSFNPSSPTLYGTSLQGTSSTSLLSQFYPRLWAYGGEIFDSHGFVSLYSPNNLKALESLAETLRYSPPNCLISPTFNIIDALLTHKLAMGISSISSISLFTSQSNLNFSDQFASVPIPCDSSVAEGWCFAINPLHGDKKEIYTFLEWFAKPEIAYAYTLLGGSSPLNSICEDKTLLQLNPALDLINNLYSTACPYPLFPAPYASSLSPLQMENMLLSILKEHFITHTSLDQLLKNAHHSLS